MKKYLSVVFITVISIVLACGGAQKKDPNVTSNTDWNVWVNTSNNQLSSYPVGGFSYKSSRVSTSKWDKWAKNAAPIVKGILDKIPQGYTLQVTGHTDSSGPEEPVGDKPGNIKISSDRAKFVHDALRRQGIKSKNLTYKGVGSSEPLSGVSSRSGKQRRVTFKVVPAQQQ
ncbi:OmpA family protein [Spirochaetota bacterium]